MIKGRYTKLYIIICLLFITAIFTSCFLISHAYYVEEKNNTAVSSFAVIQNADVILNVFLEQRDANGNGTGTYKQVYYIPRANYNYDILKTKCTNGILISSFQNGKFTIDAKNMGHCDVYFNAIDGFTSDMLYSLFVKQSDGTYKQQARIPNNDVNYSVNNSLTNCSGDAEVSILNRKVQIKTSDSNVKCAVYVDGN